MGILTVPLGHARQPVQRQVDTDPNEPRYVDHEIDHRSRAKRVTTTLSDCFSLRIYTGMDQWCAHDVPARWRPDRPCYDISLT